MGGGRRGCGGLGRGYACVFTLPGRHSLGEVRGCQKHWGQRGQLWWTAHETVLSKPTSKGCSQPLRLPHYVFRITVTLAAGVTLWRCAEQIRWSLLLLMRTVCTGLAIMGCRLQTVFEWKAELRAQLRRLNRYSSSSGVRAKLSGCVIPATAS